MYVYPQDGRQRPSTFTNRCSSCGASGSRRLPIFSTGEAAAMAFAGARVDRRDRSLVLAKDIAGWTWRERGQDRDARGGLTHGSDRGAQSGTAAAAALSCHTGRTQENSIARKSVGKPPWAQCWPSVKLQDRFVVSRKPRYPTVHSYREALQIAHDTLYIQTMEQGVLR